MRRKHQGSLSIVISLVDVGAELHDQVSNSIKIAFLDSNE
jgi:hypothetical protein